GVIHGTSAQVGTWPDAFASQPPSLKIVQMGESGPGNLVEDNTATISASLTAYNGSFTPPVGDKDMSSKGCAVAWGSAPNRVGAFAALAALALLRRQRTARS